jgi:hypothetical protein
MNGVMNSIVSSAARHFVVGFCLVLFGLDVARAQSTNTNTCVSPLNSDFFTKFTVVEAAEYVQTNASGAVPDGTNAFVFEGVVKLATNLSGSVTTAVLTVPGQSPVLMTEFGKSEFIFEVFTNALSNLTAAYPAGDYEFTVSNSTITVPLPAGYVPPNPPTLSDYAAAQAIDASNDFTLTWNAFVGGRRGDLISVSVDVDTGNGNFSSGDYGCPGQLDGTATSIVIPSNALSTNSTYRATIGFVRILTLDTNSIPGDALLGGMETITQTTLHTGPILNPAPPPILSNAAVLPGGGVQFNVMTTPGLTYTVQYNSDLSNPSGWTTLLTTNAVTNAVTFSYSPASGTAAGFYRAAQQ